DAHAPNPGATHLFDRKNGCCKPRQPSRSLPPYSTRVALRNSVMALSRRRPPTLRKVAALTYREPTGWTGLLEHQVEAESRWRLLSRLKKNLMAGVGGAPSVTTKET